LRPLLSKTRFADVAPVFPRMSLLDLEQQPTALNPASLSFQDFGTSSSGSSGGAGPAPSMGSMGSSMSSKGVGSLNFDAEPQRTASDPSSASFWSITYYQPLFDVDTVQVLNRIKGSLLPRPKGAFWELIDTNPDLYGPFWIATTLIFSMAMTGNLASYFAAADKTMWTYNFNILTLAGTVIYAYVTLLPLLVWILLRYYEASKKLVDVLCIYGYTLAIFVPISIACVIPSEFLRWLLLAIGGGISAIFLLSNFHAHLADCFPYGEGDAKRKMTLLLGAMAGFHFVLLVIFKIYFFAYA
jgi:protein YIPF1/2